MLESQPTTNLEPHSTVNAHPVVTSAEARHRHRHQQQREYRGSRLPAGGHTPGGVAAAAAKEMGRKKIQITHIADERNRQV
jgi:hypothetical protein